jgi:oligopeptide transport system substrate-binding protein
MRDRLWLSIVALALGVGLLAAAGLAGPVQRKGGTLRIGRGNFGSVDPALAEWNSSTYWLEFVTCARLYNYPDKPAPEGAIVIPEVAKGFPKVSRDGRTQTIELKRSYRFHTGQRVTAANFVADFNRVANPKLQSPGAHLLNEIVGADAVIAGRAQSISGVKALGPYRLRIRTTRPLADLVSRLTLFCPIVTNTPLQEVNDPLGSGPYYFASWVPNRQVVLERNPFYRGSRPANVDRVVLTAGVGPEECRVAVERNELDYCDGAGIPVADYAEIAAKYGINKKDGRFFFNPTFGTTYFAFNHDRPAFKGLGQIPLKQAINWALDRRALVGALDYLGGKRTDQILPPAAARAASIYPLGGVTERRLARARALFAKAKVKPRSLILYSPTPLGAQAQFFRFNLKRLGIDVEIKYFPLAAMLEKVGTRGEPFDVMVIGWSPDYADPIGFFSTLDGNRIKQSENVNFAYFDRPRYNRAIERIDRLTGAARRTAWADLDVEMMRDDPPWAPFSNGVRRDFVSRSFGCFVFQPALGRPDVAAACKK